MSALRSQLKVLVDAELSPDARSRWLAQAARDSTASLIASGKASPRYTVSVDGVPGASEDSVNGVNGVIVYDFSYIADAVAFAIGFLRARCPVDTGRYRDAFVIAIDGRPVPWASVSFASIPPLAQVIIYNPLPYSRKIDVQLVGQKPLRFSVPPGMFNDAAAAVKARFGNSAQASRLYTITRPAPWITKAGRVVESPALLMQAIQ